MQSSLSCVHLSPPWKTITQIKQNKGKNPSFRTAREWEMEPKSIQNETWPQNTVETFKNTDGWLNILNLKQTNEAEEVEEVEEAGGTRLVSHPHCWVGEARRDVTQNGCQELKMEQRRKRVALVSLCFSFFFFVCLLFWFLVLVPGRSRKLNGISWVDVAVVA